ncbi:branched-chain amino acid ABC transporter permease [Herminiimonas sp. CN]|uniref:branched-chain amino acid ABC transporter permease n=1 Tax=Herminiimonas sp. CN TaxID=1349818 RepID=UPI0004738C39|nr:branched-chain amino acid ABC transporter permease [Herminiimonas sp. CN]
MKFAPQNIQRWIVWSGFALILLIAPLIFNQGASLSVLSQIGTLMIFGLSYNMLLGQGGMLSFGHAVYSGLGAFCAIHAINLAADGSVPIPISLIPLVGGLAGMLFGVLLGYLTTRRSGTTFAMITLGMAELVFACALMLPEFFGGEGGVSANRVVGHAVLGISYGPQIQVYYLIAFWLFVSAIGMYAFTQTPLGRILNAVRDNPQRAEFIGYDPQWVRYLTLILSAFFAGIAGGLSAINFEIVSAENVSALRSGAILLFTFIGGAGFFFGPLLGAVIGVFFTVLLPGFTKAWQLYLGAFFILIVMHAPGGVASVLMQNLQLLKHRKFSRVWPCLAAISAAALLALAGAVIAIEMLYHLSLEAVNGSVMRLFGFAVDAKAAPGWIVATLLFVSGWLGVHRVQPAFQCVWDEVHAEIVHESASR